MRLPPQPLLTVLVSLLIAGCVVGHGPASVTDPTPPRELTVSERYEALTKALAAQLAAASDCSAVTRSVDAWLDAHEVELSELVPAMDAWEQEVGPVAANRYHKRLYPYVEPRIDAGMRCAADEATSRAYDRLFIALDLDR